MRVLHSLEELGELEGPVYFTIGTFDGVHRGHRAVLDELARLAAGRHGRSAVVTFEPHPQEVLRPETAPELLSAPEEKRDAMEASGVDAMLVLRFDRALAEESGEAFLRGLFRASRDARGLVLGPNTRLGRDRRTGIEEIRALAAAEGWELATVAPLVVRGEPVSSSRVRRSLLAGEVRAAAELLGRPYELDAPVVTGNGRGRDLGFPTANLGAAAPRKLLPADGIYACRVALGERRFPGALSIGVRPTFGAGPRVAEIHLLGFSGSIVGERLRVMFIERLREEKRFDSVAALQEAMAEDCRRTLELVARGEAAGSGGGDFVGGGGGEVLGCRPMTLTEMKGGGWLCL